MTSDSHTIVSWNEPHSVRLTGLIYNHNHHHHQSSGGGDGDTGNGSATDHDEAEVVVNRSIDLMSVDRRMVDRTKLFKGSSLVVCMYVRQQYMFANALQTTAANNSAAQGSQPLYDNQDHINHHHHHHHHDHADIDAVTMSSEHINQIALTDQLIGSAVIDLTTLSYGMPMIQGWYHVIDGLHSPVGQIKVTIRPTTTRAIDASIEGGCADSIDYLNTSNNTSKPYRDHHHYNQHTDNADINVIKELVKDVNDVDGEGDGLGDCDGMKYIDGDNDDDGGGMMEASLVDVDALAHDALKKSLSELATIHNQLIYRMQQQYGHNDDIHGSDDDMHGNDDDDGVEPGVGDDIMIKDAMDDDRDGGDTERMSIERSHLDHKMNGLTTLLNTRDDCGDNDASKYSFDYSSHNDDTRQGHISINNLSADDTDDASIVADSFVSIAEAVVDIDANLCPMHYPLLIDSNLIDEVDDDHANDGNTNESNTEGHRHRHRHHRSEGFSMIDNNNADNDENNHDDHHDDGSLNNDGSSLNNYRDDSYYDSYDGHHQNQMSDLINYETTTANTSSIVVNDVNNNNNNSNNLSLSIVNDSCQNITNDDSKADVDVSYHQDLISLDSSTAVLIHHEHNGDHGDDSEVMKDHFIDMKNDGITPPLLALKTHIPPALNIHSSSVSSSSSSSSSSASSSSSSSTSSSMKEDDVRAQSQWMDDSPTTVKIKTIVGQEVDRLLGDDSRRRHLHGHDIEDRDDDDGYDDHDVMRHENEQLTKSADDNHDVPSSVKQTTVNNRPVISFYVKDYSISNTSTMIDRCMDTDETELSLCTSSSNWWNKIHPSSSSHHNHEEDPQQQQNKNNYNNISSSSSNANAINDKYKIGFRHPSQYGNNNNAKDKFTDKLTYKSSDKSIDKASDKSAMIHDRIRAISDWKYGGEVSDNTNNDYNNNSTAHLRLITNKYPGKQKRFIDSETDRISKIMMGVFQKPF
jgi:hypothetical protein